MEQEVKSLIKVTALTASLMTYARFASSVTSPGKPRLLALLPAIALLPSLPFHFSTVHLRIVTVFFLVWLALFKLLLLSLGIPGGPLSPSLPLIPFIATASFPVKPRVPTSPPCPHEPTHVLTRLLIPCSLKILALAILLRVYQLKLPLPNIVHLAGYNLHVYLAVDLLLTSSAYLASFLLRADLDPQFHVPLVSTSLQDFWGRRWNLMVTDILRPSVYHPVKSRYGAHAGVLAAFAVSGIMHEILFYYLGTAGPRGEALCFFVLQGVSTVVEAKTRRRMRGRWRVPAVVWGLMSVGFVMVTSSCLLLQPLVRSGLDVKLVEESRAVMEFFVGGVGAGFKWIRDFMV